jgi:hypothetical protein
MLAVQLIISVLFAVAHCVQFDAITSISLKSSFCNSVLRHTEFLFTAQITFPSNVASGDTFVLGLPFVASTQLTYTYTLPIEAVGGSQPIVATSFWNVESQEYVFTLNDNIAVLNGQPVNGEFYFYFVPDVGAGYESLTGANTYVMGENTASFSVGTTSIPVSFTLPSGCATWASGPPTLGAGTITYNSYQQVGSNQATAGDYNEYQEFILVSPSCASGTQSNFASISVAVASEADGYAGIDCTNVQVYSWVLSDINGFGFPTSLTALPDAIITCSETSLQVSRDGILPIDAVLFVQYGSQEFTYPFTAGEATILLNTDIVVSFNCLNLPPSEAQTANIFAEGGNPAYPGQGSVDLPIATVTSEVLGVTTITTTTILATSAGESEIIVVETPYPIITVISEAISFTAVSTVTELPTGPGGTEIIIVETPYPITTVISEDISVSALTTITELPIGPGGTISIVIETPYPVTTATDEDISVTALTTTTVLPNGPGGAKSIIVETPFPFITATSEDLSITALTTATEFPTGPGGTVRIVVETPFPITTVTNEDISVTALTTTTILPIGPGGTENVVVETPYPVTTITSGVIGIEHVITTTEYPTASGETEIVIIETPLSSTLYRNSTISSSASSSSVSVSQSISISASISASATVSSSPSSGASISRSGVASLNSSISSVTSSGGRSVSGSESSSNSVSVPGTTAVSTKVATSASTVASSANSHLLSPSVSCSTALSGVTSTVMETITITKCSSGQLSATTITQPVSGGQTGTQTIIVILPSSTFPTERSNKPTTSTLASPSSESSSPVQSSESSKLIASFMAVFFSLMIPLF